MYVVLHDLTFCGSTSAVMINGNGNMPKQLMNTKVEKLANGIQFTSFKSNPDVLKYENVPNAMSPKNAPVAENNSNGFLPTRSTKFVEQ